MRFARRRLLALLAVFLMVAAAACGDDDGGGDGAATTADGGGSAEGDTVTIFGAFIDSEAEAFEEALAPFEDETGIDVQYEGTGDFTELVRLRAEGDDLADILVFPNPGLMTEFVTDGHVLELSGAALEAFEGNYNEDWQTFGSVDGAPHGMFVKAAPKSLVWYPIPEFEDAGYEIPTTWDELVALSQQIADDGNTPWCIGMEDGESTGWVGTDWMEDLVLRLHGPEVYDQWVAHEIPFDDPQIVEAATAMLEIWGNPDFVRGGTQTIRTTAFGDSPVPMFDDEPGCFLHRQASFISTFFPDEVQESLSTDEPQAGVFPLPPVEGDAAPAMGGGDVAGMTDDRDAVLQTMAFLGSPEFAAGWAPVGGYISPHEGFDTDLYPSDLDRSIGELVADAPAFRFDGSDLMPGSVGSGTFWEAIIAMVGGTAPEEALAEVEASWPS
jgi:alpha-glucoside transport system substrate-binding protein